MPATSLPAIKLPAPVPGRDVGPPIVLPPPVDSRRMPFVRLAPQSCRYVGADVVARDDVAGRARPVISTPSSVLPEMTLQSAGGVPPIVLWTASDLDAVATVGDGPSPPEFVPINCRRRSCPRCRCHPGLSPGRHWRKSGRSRRPERVERDRDLVDQATEQVGALREAADFEVAGGRISSGSGIADEPTATPFT